MQEGLSISRAEVLGTLRTILRDELLLDLDTEKIKENDGLQSVLGLDSVSFVELRVASERRFEIEIRDDEFNPQHFSSLRVLADLIEQKRCEGGLNGNAGQ